MDYDLTYIDLEEKTTFERYERCGLEGLSDQARRPFRYTNQLPEAVEAAIVQCCPLPCSALSLNSANCFSGTVAVRDRG